MDEILSTLIDFNLSRNPNTVAVMNEVNQLFDVDLRRDTKFGVMRAVFASNLFHYYGLSVSDNFPEISAGFENRINFMSAFFQWGPEMPEILQKFTKNSNVSAALRCKANDLFIGKKDMQKAMQLYNVAIMFGEPDGEELGLAFANRSAVLLEQKDPAGALKDIDLAMKHNYPERLMPKLEKRREKCVKMLLEFERSYFTPDIQSDMTKRRKYRDELLKLKKPNPLIPCAENFIEIGHSDKVGRQLVVNKDVTTGTVVMVERPFTSFNQTPFKFETSHCDSCYKFVKNGIPCKKCVFALYCSEECRSNAECGHHKFECSCLSSLYLGSVDPFSLIAFRVVCKVGPEEFYRLFTTRDPNYFDNKKPFGTESDCKYESDSYLPIHLLVSHSSSLDNQRRYGNGLCALHLMSILEAQSNFFQVSPEEKTKEFKNFVAAILLRLTETLPHNSIFIEEIKSLQGRTLGDLYRLKEVEGTIKEVLKPYEGDRFFDQTRVGIYSVGSLMNHSCDGNVIRVFDVAHGTMVVVTTRALKKGEPLTSVYGVRFETYNLLNRQAQLMQSYRFKRQCVACKSDWPTYGILQTRYDQPEFTCPTCSKKFSHEEKFSNQYLKCCLTGKEPKCGLCAKSYKRQKLQKGFWWALKKHVEASPAIEDNRPFEAVETYKELSEYFQLHVRPPSAVVTESRLLFHHALALILQCE